MYCCRRLRDGLTALFEFEGILGRQGETDATSTSQKLGAALVLQLVPDLLNRIHGAHRGLAGIWRDVWQSAREFRVENQVPCPFHQDAQEGAFPGREADPGMVQDDVPVYPAFPVYPRAEEEQFASAPALRKFLEKLHTLLGEDDVAGPGILALAVNPPDRGILAGLDSGVGAPLAKGGRVQP
jgi:hypothetical protein